MLSLAPLAGGMIIGSSAAAKMALTGRILGVSGTVGGLVRGQPGFFWRASFTAGLVGGGLCIAKVAPEAFYTLPETFPVWRAAVGGLLVGYGTSLGNGCTSGHGICGLSRLSTRSLVAVMTFMATGFATATALRTASATAAPLASQAPAQAHALLADCGLSEVPPTVVGIAAAAFLAALITPALLALPPRTVPAPATGAGPAPGAGANATAGPWNKTVQAVAEAALGVAFAVGLGLSGMVSPHKVASFLDLSEGFAAWDPALMLVMGGALMIGIPSFQAIIRSVRRQDLPLQSQGTSRFPLLGGRCELPSSTAVDRRLVAGAAVFGAGWGVAGICPGPALVALANPTALSLEQPAVLLFNAAMLFGMFLFKYVQPQLK